MGRSINRKGVSLDRKTLFIIVVLCFLIVPSYISSIDILLIDYFLKAGKYAAILLVGFFYLTRNKISLLFILTACVYITIIYSTLINNGNLISSIRSLLVALFFIMITENESEHLDKLWNAMIFYMSLLIIINLITIIVYPHGLYTTAKIYEGVSYIDARHWFLGFKNGIGKYCLFLLFFISDRDLKKQGRLSGLFYLMFAISMISVILIKSAMSIAIILLFGAGVIFANIIRRNRFAFFNIYNLMIVFAILYILIIVMQNFGLFNHLMIFFGKNATTFGNRLAIWNKAIHLINEKPLLGYGYIDSNTFRGMLGKKDASDAHNFFLTLALNGGFIAVVFYILVLLLLVRNIRAYQYSYQGIVLTLFTFLFMTHLIVENTSNMIYYSIFAYAASCSGKQPNRSSVSINTVMEPMGLQ